MYESLLFTAHPLPKPTRLSAEQQRLGVNQHMSTPQWPSQPENPQNPGGSAPVPPPPSNPPGPPIPPPPNFGQPLPPNYGTPPPGYGQPLPPHFGQPAQSGQPQFAPINPPQYGQAGAYPPGGGYPPPPPYGTQPPPAGGGSGGSGKVIAGIVAAVIVVVGIAAVLFFVVFSNDDDTSGSGSPQASVRAYFTAADKDDFDTIVALTCAADRDDLRSDFDENSDDYTDDEYKNIKIGKVRNKGNVYAVDVTLEYNGDKETDTVSVVKESGKYLLCPSRADDLTDLFTDLAS
jgi:hypothetical protein